tara:strand:+ start:79 stop:273 length:195 start_codon:yes stop_codon:yes gene_type:complete
MSRYAKTTHIIKQEEKVESLNVKDTDFLLKLIMQSQFSGTEVEIAYKVINKLSKIHRRNIDGES